MSLQFIVVLGITLDKRRRHTRHCVCHMLEKGSEAVECVTEAVKLLEDSKLTNAGRGSSLNIRGCVECDASIMEGKKLLFGAVGAISGVQNPIEVSAMLINRQLGEKLSLGRLHPRSSEQITCVIYHLQFTISSITGPYGFYTDRRYLMMNSGYLWIYLDIYIYDMMNTLHSVLVGEGASQWAVANGIHKMDPRLLITDESQKTYNNHKRKLDSHNQKVSKKRKIDHQSDDKNEEIEDLQEDKDVVQDTVGAVVMDTRRNIASAVSSGGISLKQPGRLGPAAIYGAGCWAYNQRPGKPGVGTVTSGSGEHIIRTVLARECAMSIQRENNASLGLSQGFKQSLLESEFLSEEEEKYAGVLALVHNEDNTAEVLWGHTTDSMCVGYMSSSLKKPKVVMSRLPTGGIPGKSFTMLGMPV
nr:threonine aspartase 1-like isoform X3 [Crassostrea gigas]